MLHHSMNQLAIFFSMKLASVLEGSKEGQLKKTNVNRPVSDLSSTHGGLFSAKSMARKGIWERKARTTTELLTFLNAGLRVFLLSKGNPSLLGLLIHYIQTT